MPQCTPPTITITDPTHCCALLPTNRDDPHWPADFSQIASRPDLVAQLEADIAKEAASLMPTVIACGQLVTGLLLDSRIDKLRRCGVWAESVLFNAKREMEAGGMTKEAFEQVTCVACIMLRVGVSSCSRWMIIDA